MLKGGLAIMGLPAFKERRFSRRRLTGLLPGRLVKNENHKDLMCKPVDVSEHGIGILCSEVIQPGTIILLVLKDREVQLQIAWGQQDFGKRDLYRYGLVTVDQKENLERIFEKGGCFLE